MYMMCILGERRQVFVSSFHNFTQFSLVNNPIKSRLDPVFSVTENGKVN